MLGEASFPLAHGHGFAGFFPEVGLVGMARRREPETAGPFPIPVAVGNASAHVSSFATAQGLAPAPPDDWT